MPTFGRNFRTRDDYDVPMADNDPYVSGPDLSKNPQYQGAPGYSGAPSYPQQYGPPPLPPTNMGWAAAALLFFWPLSFSAFTHASNVFPKWSIGDYQGAQYASDRAKQLGKWSLFLAIGLFVVFVVLYAVVIAVALSVGSSLDTTY